MADSQLRAGAAASNITPPLGVSINGGMSDRTADFVHDELHARCLVLESGTTRLAIVVCDSCMLPQSILNKAKHLAHSHTGIPIQSMLVSATHTHTAPTAAGVFQSEPDLPYCEFLAVRISDAIRRAADGPLKGILGYTDDKLVSMDFNHDPHSSVFATEQTKVMEGGKLCRILTWHDNEWGFSNRMSDVAVAMAQHG